MRCTGRIHCDLGTWELWGEKKKCVKKKVEEIDTDITPEPTTCADGIPQQKQHQKLAVATKAATSKN